MNSEIKLILDDVKRGELSVDDAALKIKVKPFEDIGYAKVDLHRKVRQGAAEVIYGAEKTAEQINGIASAMKDSGQEVILITRLSPEKSRLFTLSPTTPRRGSVLWESFPPRTASAGS